jgi:hypothetical protein
VNVAILFELTQASTNRCRRPITVESVVTQIRRACLLPGQQDDCLDSFIGFEILDNAVSCLAPGCVKAPASKDSCQRGIATIMVIAISNTVFLVNHILLRASFGLGTVVQGSAGSIFQSKFLTKF